MSEQLVVVTYDTLVDLYGAADADTASNDSLAEADAMLKLAEYGNLDASYDVTVGESDY
jgi:hypothetical protein